MKKVIMWIVLVTTSNVFSFDTVSFVCRNSLDSLVSSGCKFVEVRGKRAVILKDQFKTNIKCLKSQPVVIFTDSNCVAKKSASTASFKVEDLINNRDYSSFPSSRTH